MFSEIQIYAFDVASYLLKTGYELNNKEELSKDGCVMVFKAARQVLKDAELPGDEIVDDAIENGEYLVPDLMKVTKAILEQDTLSKDKLIAFIRKMYPYAKIKCTDSCEDLLTVLKNCILVFSTPQ